MLWLDEKTLVALQDGAMEPVHAKCRPCGRRFIPEKPRFAWAGSDHLWVGPWSRDCLVGATTSQRVTEVYEDHCGMGYSPFRSGISLKWSDWFKRHLGQGLTPIEMTQSRSVESTLIHGS